MKKNILFAALMCLPLLLMAGKRDYYKDPKYLGGDPKGQTNTIHEILSR